MTARLVNRVRAAVGDAEDGNVDDRATAGAGGLTNGDAVKDDMAGNAGAVEHAGVAGDVGEHDDNAADGGKIRVGAVDADKLMVGGAV